MKLVKCVPTSRHDDDKPRSGRVFLYASDRILRFLIDAPFARLLTQGRRSCDMNKFWTIVIWILVFVIVTGSTQIAIESLVPSEWVQPSSILAIVLGWWVAELVRKRNVAKG
jgi:hypothetical protein